MNPDTRTTVQEAAARLGYEVNRHAAALRRRRSGVLGLIMPEISGSYTWALAKAVQMEGRRQGYSLSLCLSYGGLELEQELVRTMIGEGVDGLVLLGVWLAESGRDVRHLYHLQDLELPFVFVDTYPDAVPGHYVVTDNALGGRLAAEHLLGLGHRRIAYLTPATEFLSSLRERFRGFTAALADRQVELSPELVLQQAPPRDPREGELPGPDQRWASLAAKVADAFSSLPAMPTAVLCATPDHTCAVLKWAHDQDVAIPEELSLVTFDDVPSVGALGLKLTSVRQPAEEMGCQAVQILLREIAGERAATPTQLRLPPSLIIGNTTAPPPRGERR